MPDHPARLGADLAAAPPPVVSNFLSCFALQCPATACLFATYLKMLAEIVASTTTDQFCFLVSTFFAGDCQAFGLHDDMAGLENIS